MAISSLSSLQQRVISALVLAPLAIAALYFGDIWFFLFLAGAAAIMSYEWCHASLETRPGLITLIMAASIIAALVFAREVAFLHLFAILLSGAVLMGIVAFASKKRDHLLAAFAGPFVIGVPVLSLLLLRDVPGSGFALTFSLFLVIWATDIGAYFSGKTIGGPKILPKISPNKTWAGLIGGMISAAIVALLANYFLVNAAISPIAMLGLGAICAILAQVGDFSESAWKRYYGIKDASNLIPGHGGVMDRLDGVFLTAPLLTGLVLINNGMMM